MTLEHEFSTSQQKMFLGQHGRYGILWNFFHW